MQPVRKVLSATHFKPIAVPDDTKVKWTPCSPGDPDAVERAWTDVESDELLEPPLRVADFVRAVNSVRPTVTEEDIRKHDQWTNDSGMVLSNWWCMVDRNCLRKRRCIAAFMYILGVQSMSIRCFFRILSNYPSIVSVISSVLPAIRHLLIRGM